MYVLFITKVSAIRGVFKTDNWVVLQNGLSENIFGLGGGTELRFGKNVGHL